MSLAAAIERTLRRTLGHLPEGIETRAGELVAWPDKEAGPRPDAATLDAWIAEHEAAPAPPSAEERLARVEAENAALRRALVAKEVVTEAELEEAKEDRS